MQNATFVTSYMKQNKSRKQTLESAQNGLEIIFKQACLEIFYRGRDVVAALSTGSTESQSYFNCGR